MFRITIEKSFDISGKNNWIVFDEKFNSFSDLKKIVKTIPETIKNFTEKFHCKDHFFGAICFSIDNDFTWGGNWETILEFYCGSNWIKLELK